MAGMFPPIIYQSNSFTKLVLWRNNLLWFYKMFFRATDLFTFIRTQDLRIL